MLTVRTIIAYILKGNWILGSLHCNFKSWTESFSSIWVLSATAKYSIRFANHDDLLYSNHLFIPLGCRIGLASNHMFFSSLSQHPTFVPPHRTSLYLIKIDILRYRGNSLGSIVLILDMPVQVAHTNFSSNLCFGQFHIYYFIVCVEAFKMCAQVPFTPWF